jgi:hypothetical protein
MSLFQVQKEAFVADLKRFRSSHRHLIVDDTTYPIIQKLFNDDVLNYVYTCKKIDGDRSKNRDSALYLLDPTRNYSINCLAADFSNGQRYKDCVVMFMPGPWNLFWNELIKNQNFINSLQIQQIPYIVDYLSFVPLEPRLFVTGNYHSIPAYFRPERHGKNFYKYQIDMAINSMMGICVLNNEYPIIRYYNSKISKELAFNFQQRLDDYYREHPDIIPLNSKTIFLITDRTMDLFGPVCHYQFYRSQIFDLLDDVEIERDVDPSAKYSYSVQTGEGLIKKTLKFNETDPIYMEIKDLSIERATSRIRELYNDLKLEDERFSGKNLETANGLRHALVNKDTHAEKKALITGHYLLCENMWKIIKEEHLGDIITFENLCAAGMGPLDNLKMPVTDGLLHLLKNPTVTVYNKIRLLISYAIYRNGLIKADLKKLLLFSMPDKTENVLKLFENLQSLGVVVLKNNLSQVPKKKNSYFGVNDTENQMDIYKPAYSNILSRLVYNKLSEYYNTLTLDTTGYSDEDDESLKTFPFVKAGPTPAEMDGITTTRNQPKWKSTKSTNDVSRQKLIIFCAGGLTPSELSTISSMEDELNRNIIIGTDEVYTVWDMLGDITLINEDEFEFPLKQKLEKKQVPQFLIDDSIDPGIFTKQPQQQQQQQQQQQPRQQQQQSQHDISSASASPKSQDLNSHKFKFGLHSRKKSSQEDKNDDVSDKKKVKGMMKKLKKFNI